MHIITWTVPFENNNLKFTNVLHLQFKINYKGNLKKGD